MRNYYFQVGGLRFDMEYLQEVWTLIHRQPIEVMAEHVDGITHELVKHSEHFDIPSFSPELAEQLNTTAIGNVAYVGLYHMDLKMRQSCVEFIAAFVKYRS